MMKRRIFPWMGLIVLFLLVGLNREAFSEEVYKVRHGDTLARIAKRYGISPASLKEANGLQGTVLKDNQVLTIPKPIKQRTAKAKKSPEAKDDYYRVKKGDTLFAIAQKTGVSVSDLRERNNLRGTALKRGQKLLLATRDKRPEQTTKPDSASVKQGELEEEDGDLAGDLPGDAAMAEAENTLSSHAELMGKWHDPEERRLFVKVATAFLGAPYRMGGISLRGLDCSAFVKKIYQLFDISLPRTAREQSHVGVGVARNDLIEGDLVFFNTKRSIGHVGIYIGNNQFVHASSRNRGVRIDSLNEPYFDKRFVKAVRLKGTDEGVL